MNPVIFKQENKMLFLGDKESKIPPQNSNGNVDCEKNQKREKYSFKNRHLKQWNQTLRQYLEEGQK